MINRLADELLVAAGRRPPEIDPTNTLDADGVAKQIKHWAKETEKLMTSHPVASLAAALGIGVALGWWVKRS